MKNWTDEDMSELSEVAVYVTNRLRIPHSLEEDAGQQIALYYMMMAAEGLEFETIRSQTLEKMEVWLSEESHYLNDRVGSDEYAAEMSQTAIDLDLDDDLMRSWRTEFVRQSLDELMEATGNGNAVWGNSSRLAKDLDMFQMFNGMNGYRKFTCREIANLYGTTDGCVRTANRRAHSYLVRDLVQRVREMETNPDFSRDELTV